MPKMKSRRAAAKRFKITGTGKLKFKKGGLRHNLENKSSNTKRKLTKAEMVKSCDAGRMKRALGYN